MAITAADLVVKLGTEGAGTVKNDLADIGSSVNQTTKSGGVLANALATGIGFVGAQAFMAATSAAKDFLGSIVSTGMSFEAQMSAVRAVTGATDEEFDALTNLALQIGKDTQFGASEAAVALEELAKAGMSTDAILGGAAESTTMLAAAGGVSMPEAASVMSAAMNQFGISADESMRVADLLAASAAVSATGVLEMGESLRYVGVQASAMGYDIETITTALAIMADQGLVGSTAGTSLNQALLSMANPTALARKEMGKLGISFTDASGNMKAMPDIISEVAAATKDMGAADRAAALERMFGVEGGRAMLALLNAESDAAKSAGKSWDDYYTAVTKQGVASEQAAIRMDNTLGAIEEFKGALETIAIMGAMTFLPMLRGVIDGATGVADVIVNWMGKLQVLRDSSLPPVNIALLLLKSILTDLFGPKVANTVTKFFSRVLKSLGEFMRQVKAVVNAIKRFSGRAFEKMFDFIVRHGDMVTLILKGVAIGLGVVAAAMLVAATATGVFGSVLAVVFSPITLIVAAIAALYVAYKTNFMGFADGVRAAIEFLMPAIDKLRETFATLKDAFDVGGWSGLWQGIQQVATGAVDAIVGKFPALGPIFDDVATAARAVYDVVADVVGNVIDFATQESAIENYKKAWRLLRSAVNLYGNAIVFVVGKVIDFATQESTVRAFKRAWDDLKGAINAISFAIKWVVGKVIDFSTHERTIEAAKLVWEGLTSAVNGVMAVYRFVMNFNLDFRRLEPIIDAFKLVWDGLTSAVNGVIAVYRFVTSFNLDFSRLEPIIDAFKLAWDGLTTAVDAVIAAYRFVMNFNLDFSRLAPLITAFQVIWFGLATAAGVVIGAWETLTSFKLDFSRLEPLITAFQVIWLGLATAAGAVIAAWETLTSFKLDFSALTSLIEPFRKIWDDVTGAVNAVKDAINALAALVPDFSGITAAIDKILAPVQKLKDLWDELMGKIGGGGSGEGITPAPGGSGSGHDTKYSPSAPMRALGGGNFGALGGGMGGGMSAKGGGLFGGIAAAATTEMANARTAITSGMAQITAAIANGAATATTAYSTLIAQLGTVTRATMAIATTAVSSGMATIIATVANGMATVVSVAASLMAAYRGAVASGMAAAVGTTRAGVSAIIAAASGGRGAMASAGVSIGAALGQGIASGIRGMIGQVAAASAAIVTASIDAAKRAGAISSPSQIMRTDVGQMLGLGAVLGVEDMIPRMASALDSLIATPTVDPYGSRLTGAPVGGGQVTTVNIANVTVDLNGAKELLEFGEFVNGLGRDHEIVFGAGGR